MPPPHPRSVDFPEPAPRETTAQRRARIERSERLIEAEEKRQRRRHSKRLEEIQRLKNNRPDARVLRARDRRAGSLSINPSAISTGFIISGEEHARRHSWGNAEKVQRTVDNQLRRELETAVYLQRRNRIREKKIRMNTGVTILQRLLLFLFILFGLWCVGGFVIPILRAVLSIFRPTRNTPFAQTGGPIILQSLSTRDYGNTLLDLLPGMEDLSHGLMWVGTAISDLALIVQLSQLNTRTTINHHLQGFRVLHDEMSDQLLQRNAAALSLVNQIIFDNERTSALLQRYADQSDDPESLPFLAVIDEIDESATHMETAFQALFNHDVQLRKNLASSRAELDRVKHAFARDAVHVEHSKDQVIQDRNIWSILFVAAGGREGDMGLVERNVVTLGRIDAFFPEIENRFILNADTMMKGILALKAFRDEIRKYRSLSQHQRLGKPAKALVMVSAHALRRANGHMIRGAEKMAQFKQGRRDLFLKQLK